jgi:kumamolisin
MWAGLIARLNQVMKANAGYITPLLYESSFADVFYDITKGCNGSYQAETGWDACTGLGSPDGKKLLSALRTNSRGATGK